MWGDDRRVQPQQGGWRCWRGLGVFQTVEGAGEPDCWWG